MVSSSLMCIFQACILLCRLLCAITLLALLSIHICSSVANFAYTLANHLASLARHSGRLTILTMLQFLVSIQERVLNADPLFHQPGFVDSGPLCGCKILVFTIQRGHPDKITQDNDYIMNKPPKVNFEAFVVGPFSQSCG
ncbi:hypothetical protein HanRHA438_Chr03g0114681 [Helianthus annuus]|nr:hypothetical protein HanRHA438_Chr03g0114681 [Helianthus annuus]